ncbi:MAG: hypothetical protein J1F66_04275 [Clostridiales bacterium]|nr:hypothetical protein [Clostridiales bacterium]
MFKPLSLAAFNWKVLLKSILYQILLLALVLALGFTIFGKLVDDLIQLINDTHISDFASDTISSIVNGEFDSATFTGNLNEVISNLQKGISSLRHPFGVVELTYILVVLIVLLYRLLISLTDVSVACQLEEFMTSNASRPFTWFFFKKQGRTWKFALLQTAFTLPLDILVVTGSVGFYLLFLIAFNWWTIIPVAVIALLMYAVRLTFFAFCLPAVACEDIPVREAFKRGLSLIISRFWRVFWKTLIVVCVMVVVSVLAIVFIDNTWVISIVFTVPNFMLFFYLKCINIVEYFQADNRPFFHKRVDIEGTDRYNRRLARKARRS